ncbi:hypothetical protein [Loktanella sp. S4079]|uniref:hypothetical protein n=1 Tax=Loktanella sp. S4079 TaxID=579483 RepID=UPI0005FA8E0E|nr:hypothetical protein [Loktanella sp. S4079]KJZ19610.1 hypothetical protein TW80_01505 [Loktanella sp. S4079]
MTDCVWLCQASDNIENMFGFDWPEDHLTLDEQVARDNKIILADRRGTPLSADDLPTRLETKADMDLQEGTGHGPMLPERLPHVISWTCPIVSADVAAVLREHDIGRSNLYPVELFRQDKGVSYPQSFFVLNIGEAKTAVLPDQSVGLRRALSKNVAYTINYGVIDDALVVEKDCLGNPDIWVDPLIQSHAFFVSDRLHDGFVNAGLVDAFAFSRCKSLKP